MDAKDKAQAELAQLAVQGGQVYRHYKGGLYTVIAVALKENDLSQLVVYRSVKKQTIWVRTVEDFTSFVHVHGVRQRRFEEVT